MTTTYHRTILTIEILGTEPYEYGLESLSGAVDNNFSGTILAQGSTQVEAEDMAALLRLQGSDPEFLILDDSNDD